MAFQGLATKLKYCRRQKWQQHQQTTIRSHSGDKDFKEQYQVIGLLSVDSLNHDIVPGAGDRVKRSEVTGRYIGRVTFW